MRKLWIFSFLFMMGCGIGLETLTLTDESPSSTNFDEAFRYFRAPLVFRNDLTNVWGLEQDDCKKFEAVSLEGEHSTAIQLDWNKTSCDWVGFGIGWNNWLPKDLAGIMQGTDLVMDLRAIDDEAGIPIMVFLLEDYSGVMSAAVGGAHCLERYPINEEWQSFRMPMADFDYHTCGIDLTNVKQLVVEVQGRGQIIVDNIRIEAHKENRPANKKVFPPHTILANERSIVFEGNTSGIWGLGTYPSRNFRVEDGVLTLDWDHVEEAHYHRMGITWDDWKNIDMTSLVEEGKLIIELDSFRLAQGDLNIVLESYHAGTALLSLKKWLKSEEGTAMIVEIPLDQFTADMDFWKRIKQLQLITEGQGELAIKSIEIVGNEN